MIDFQKVREALYVFQVDASSGAGARLNQALAANDLSSVMGDAAVKDLVGSLLTKTAGGEYFASVNDVLNALSGNTSAPQTPPPTIPVPSTPAPVVNVPQDLRSQVIAILNEVGLEIKSDGKLREIHLKAGAVTHTISNTENDRGFRRTSNFQIPGWRDGSTHTDPRLCQISEADEQDGGHSITYGRPDLVPNPNIEEELTPGDFDWVPGKSVYTRFADYMGRHMKRVTRGTGKPGCEYAMGVVSKNGTPNVLEDRIVATEEGALIIGVLRIQNPDGSTRKL